MAEINFWSKVEDRLADLGILEKGREKWGKKLNENELAKAEAWIAEKMAEHVTEGSFTPLFQPMKYDHFGYHYGQLATYGVKPFQYTILHPGTDMNRGFGAQDLNDPLFAIADGVVTYKGWATGFGWHLFIIHDINHPQYGKIRVWAHYMHLRVQPIIAVGEKVKGGQIVARVGNTGTTSPHCHFELRKKPLGVLFWSELKGKDRKWLDERFWNPESFF